MGDLLLYLIYHTRSVKTISRIPYASSNCCAVLCKNPQRHRSRSEPHALETVKDSHRAGRPLGPPPAPPAECRFFAAAWQAGSPLAPPATPACGRFFPGFSASGFPICDGTSATVYFAAAVISCRGVPPPAELPPRPVVCRFPGGPVLQRSRGNTVRPAAPYRGDPPRRADHPARRGAVSYR